MENGVLRIDRLTTGYGRGAGRRVVSAGLSAALPAGSVTCLVGTNGAGKSTLLRTLAGLQAPLGGEVYWMGRPLAACSRRRLARTVAVVLTLRPATGWMTAAEAVATGRMPYTGALGRLSGTDRAIVAGCLRRVGAEALAARPLAALSDGECQRVMVARALAQQTPAILLDEPAAFLDLPAKARLMALLQQLAHEEGKTLLLSTHDVEWALRGSDFLWLLSGTGLRTGTPRQLAADGSIAALFGSGELAFDPQSMRFSLHSAPCGAGAPPTSHQKQPT